MPYYYDKYGWHTQEVLPDRATEVAPPDTIPEGKAANWTGHRWIILTYRPPPVEDIYFKPSITRHQLKVALHRAGWLDNVESWVAGLADRELKLAFLEIREFHRQSAIIEAMRIQFNRTHEQINTLFDVAITVEP